jgi:hypothetical protein
MSEDPVARGTAPSNLYGSPRSYETAEPYAEPSGWAGWVVFAGIMMIIGGSLNIIYGVVALVDHHWSGWGNLNHLYLSVNSWGWILLIMGIIVLISGFGVMTGNLAARIVGICIASLSLLGNFFVIPLYPFWALTIIVLDTLVIWALAAHGKEMKQVYD